MQVGDIDPILEALSIAPVVPLTDEEQALLDESERAHTRWISQADFVTSISASRPSPPSHSHAFSPARTSCDKLTSRD